MSLEALLAVIDSVETHCHFMMVSSKEVESKDSNVIKNVEHPNESPLSSREELMRPVAASGIQLAAVVASLNENDASLKAWNSVAAASSEREDTPLIPTHEQASGLFGGRYLNMYNWSFGVTSCMKTTILCFI